ncbi:SpoIIE family protein phosphatase [Streptomyces cucumeris]|uniref:SpoIIE family protein phosphatase n=1 Tax=Streptomyces cucumeris TaxID=2962890 RepID=UPI003EC06892
MPSAGRKHIASRGPGSPSPDRTPLQTPLTSAVQEAVVELDAVAGIVYFVEDDCEGLRAALIGGTPPAVFTMPERIPLDGPYASSTAWRTGTIVVIGEPVIRPDDPGLARLVPFPYSAVATPLSAHGHQFGVLTLIRIPSRDGMLTAGQRRRLREIGDRLAHDLVPSADGGAPSAPAPDPVVFPVYPADPCPAPVSAAVWGLPDVRGSSGMTLMYQLHKLSGALNEAVDIDAVVAAARSRIMEPCRARSVVISTVSDGRLWVVGHCGTSTGVLRLLHGSSADGGSPTADVLRGRDPLLFADRSELLAAYPDTPEDGCRAWAFLPLRAHDTAVGVCGLGFAEERRFGAEEQAVVMMMAGLLAQALERARLSESAHALAESLQKRLLPRILSDLPDVITTARYLPAPSSAGVGGDWYEVITLPGGRICLVVGDVEGHNVESSAVMGQLRSAVLAYAREGHGPAAVLTRTSNLLTELATELLATCCFVCLDVTEGAVEAALAGHPAPLVRRPDGRTEALDIPADVPLGVYSDVPYRTYETTLEPGSLLLLYTDGLIGVRTPDALPRVRSLLAAGHRNREHNLEGLADRLIATVPPPPERRDDVVLLLARYEGTPLELRPRFNRLEIQRHDLQGVKATRRFVRESLAAWDRDTLADDLELMASEVVTNALIHADSHVDLRLRACPDHIRLEVRDSDATPPVPSALSASDEENAQAEHGRGLLIVESLATAWGTSPSGRGKTIWLELST